MKLKTLAGILCLAITLVACQNNAPEPQYPSYEKVLAKLIEGAGPEKAQTPFSAGNSERLQFAKKREGWFVKRFDYGKAENPLLDEVLIWDATANQFQIDELGYLNQFSATELEQQLQASYYGRGFAIHPYYGYDGWSSDVIDDFSDFDSYSDTLLYGLARAYADYASGLVFSNDTISYPECFNLEIDEAISPEQLSTYKKYTDQGLKLFGDLVGQNPNFETLVGRIKTKYANQHLTAYMDLLIAGASEADAKAYLKDDLYDPVMLALAHNHLTSCKPNAILFTVGDNDTYPLWYVQQKVGFRPDVSVINLSLLNVNSYLDQVRRSTGSTQAVSTTLTPAVYRNEARNFISAGGQGQRGSGAYLPLGAALSLIEDDQNIQTFENNNFVALPSFNLVFLVDSGLTPQDFGASAEDSSIVDNIYIDLQKRSSLYKGDYMFLDIIRTNNWQRPIYMVSGASPYNRMGLDANLHGEGLNLHLLPYSKPASLDGTPVNRVVMEDNLLNKYDYEWTNQWPTDPSKNEERQLRTYRLQFIMLSNALVSDNELSRAAEVLDRGLALVAPEKAALEDITYYATSLYYRSEQSEKAAALAKPYSEELYQKLQDQLEKMDVLSEEEQYEFRRNMSLLKALSQEIQAYDSESELNGIVEGWANEIAVLFAQKSGLDNRSVMPSNP